MFFPCMNSQCLPLHWETSNILTYIIGLADLAPGYLSELLCYPLHSSVTILSPCIFKHFCLTGFVLLGCCQVSLIFELFQVEAEL